MITHVAAAFSVALGFSCASALAADTYPTRPIRLVVPFAPGGGSDVVGRTIGQKLGEYLGQTVVVDNRPGAASLVGTELVARAPADGYTLLLADIAFTVNSAYYVKQVRFDILKDFTPIALVAETPYVLLVNPTVPAATLKEFLALAAQQPGKINLGSSGTGTGPHLTLELLKVKTGANINHVPYKGGFPALSEVMSGQIQATIIGMGGVLQFVQSGKLRALAVADRKRSAALPNVPTFDEAGADIVVTNWYGVVGRAGTPQAVVKRLYDEIGRALTQNDVRERLRNTGLEPVAQTPGNFQRRIESELKRWNQVIKEARIQTE
jgi:tripartite-type tricarboxylate transporter receptor subunit TctC